MVNDPRNTVRHHSRKGSHVVMDVSKEPARMRCLHCGAEHPMKLPMALTDAAKVSKAFLALHEDCEARA